VLLVGDRVDHILEGEEISNHHFGVLRHFRKPNLDRCGADTLTEVTGHLALHQYHVFGFFGYLHGEVLGLFPKINFLLHRPKEREREREYTTTIHPDAHKTNDDERGKVNRWCFPMTHSSIHTCTHTHTHTHTQHRKSNKTEIRGKIQN
jgi:hypothetical protein